MEYQLIDADEHYYEPDDCFTRHIEARFRDETVRVRRDGDGLGRVFVRGQRTFMSVMPATTPPRPGALEGLFAGEVADGFTHREVINARDYPAFTGKRARLALMDEQGVQAAIMLPTLGVAVEYDLRSDVALAYASLRAFNRWLEEDWGYGADGRIFGVPMLSLLDIDQALAELHRVIAAGARLVHLCPGPAGARSPADPLFDPFWATVAEAGIPVVFHVSNSGYQHFYGTHWSENPDNPSHRQSPLQWALCNTERPVVDTFIALTLHNLFGRHPGVRDPVHRERLELAEAAVQDRRQGGRAGPPRAHARRPASAPAQRGAGRAPVGLPVPRGRRDRAHRRHRRGPRPVRLGLPAPGGAARARATSPGGSRAATSRSPARCSAATRPDCSAWPITRRP